MRQDLLECLQNHKMKGFPRFRTLTDQVPPVDITKDIDSTHKWVIPRKHAKTKTLFTDNIHNDISTKNKYALLTDQTDNVDFSTQHVTEKGTTHSICDVHEAETIHKYQAVQPKSKTNKHNNIFNLSNRQLKTDEGPVLELGKSFCPATKYLNKEQTTNDFYSFIRRLKIFEYFHENPTCRIRSTLPMMLIQREISLTGEKEIRTAIQTI